MKSDTLGLILLGIGLAIVLSLIAIENMMEENYIDLPNPTLVFTYGFIGVGLVLASVIILQDDNHKIQFGKSD